MSLTKVVFDDADFPLKTDLQVEDEPDLNSSRCTCSRLGGWVICPQCGEVQKGRLRKPCQRHRRKIFLHDISECSKCGLFGELMTETPEN